MSFLHGLFLSDPGIPGVRSMGPSLSHSQANVCETYTSYTSYTSGVIWWPNLELMQVAPSGDQICNQWKWCHMVAKFATNASSAIWWTILQLMQIAPSGGQICN